MNTTTICFPLRVLLMIPLVALFHVSFTQSLTDTDPWQFSSQRPEIAPVNGIDDEIMIHDAPTLKLAGNGDMSANGCWFVNVPVKSMSWYRFKTLFKADNIEEQSRSVLARIIWQDEEGKLVNRAEYPTTLNDINRKWLFNY
jgi:hypothetical protein